MHKKQVDLKLMFGKEKRRLERTMKEFNLYDSKMVKVTKYEKHLTVEINNRRFCIWLK